TSDRRSGGTAHAGAPASGAHACLSGFQDGSKSAASSFSSPFHPRGVGWLTGVRADPVSSIPGRPADMAPAGEFQKGRTPYDPSRKDREDNPGRGAGNREGDGPGTDRTRDRGRRWRRRGGPHPAQDLLLGL